MRIKNKEIRSRRQRKEKTIKAAIREAKAGTKPEKKAAAAPAAEKPAAKKPAAPKKEVAKKEPAEKKPAAKKVTKKAEPEAPAE